MLPALAWQAIALAVSQDSRWVQAVLVSVSHALFRRCCFEILHSMPSGRVQHGRNWCLRCMPWWHLVDCPSEHLQRSTCFPPLTASPVHVQGVVLRAIFASHLPLAHRLAALAVILFRTAASLAIVSRSFLFRLSLYLR